MGLLVEDLLLLARLDAQRPLDRHRVDLLALASDAVHDAHSIAPKRKITMEVFDGPGTPEVLGDEARLRQVLGNLVANALQHTPETARHHGAGRHRRRQRGARGRRRGPRHEQGGRAPGVRAVLPHRLVPRPGQRRHRAGAVDRRLAGLRARRHGHRHHRAGQGCRFKVSLPRIADVAAHEEQSARAPREAIRPVRPAPP